MGLKKRAKEGPLEDLTFDDLQDWSVVRTVQRKTSVLYTTVPSASTRQGYLVLVYHPIVCKQDDMLSQLRYRTRIFKP